MLRTVSLLTVASLLALPFAPALAQTAQPPPAPIQQPPPPPLQVPPPPRAAAEWATGAGAERPTPLLSQRLVLNRGPTGSGAFRIERGGVLLTDSRYATGLDLALMGSVQAVELAQEAHQKLVSGGVLTWTGVGITALAFLVEVFVVVDAASNQGDVSSTLDIGTGSAAGALLVGLILEAVGGTLTQAGLRLECDAVNAYNSDLVDGKLQAR